MKPIVSVNQEGLTASVSDAPPSYQDGDEQPLSMTSQGRLRVSTEAPSTDFFSEGNPWTDSPYFDASPW
jgi:hypothetical protein